MTGSIRAGYDTRTYNLQANVPQALPSAREFLIISTTVDISTIGFNLGDNNGDFELWPFGFAIGVKEGSIKARIVSTVAQTVVVAMVDGEATVKDTRFAPGAGSLAVTMIDGANVSLGARGDAAATTDIGTFSLISLIKRLLSKTGGAPTAYASVATIAAARGSAFLATTVVASGTNINGIQVTTATIACGTDVTASASINDNTNDLAIAADSQVLSLPSFTIPAGRPLRVLTTGLCNVCVTYRIL